MKPFIDPLFNLSNSIFWLETILDLSCKASIILGIAIGLLHLWKKISAAIRHAILCLAIFGLLVVPIISFLLPSWELPYINSVLPEKPFSTISFDPGTKNKAFGNAKGIHKNGIEAERQDQKREISSNRTLTKDQLIFREIHWSTWLQLIWIIGAIGVVIRLFMGYIGIRRAVSHSFDIGQIYWNKFLKDAQNRLHITKTIQLRQSPYAKIPFAVGWYRPIIMFPQEASTWSEQRIKIVLMHELAHIKRNDGISTFVTHLVTIFYWFNPLVWLTLRQIYIERERASDDVVLSMGTKASEYAYHLLDIAKKVHVLNWSSPIGVAMAQKHKLEERLMSILNHKIHHNRLKPLTLTMIILFSFTIILPLASVQTWAQKETVEFGKDAVSQFQHTSNQNVKQKTVDTFRVEMKNKQKKQDKNKEYQTINIKYNEDSSFVYLYFDDEDVQKMGVLQTKIDSLNKWSLYEDTKGHLVLKYKQNDKDCGAYFIVTEPHKGTFSITTDSTKKKKILKIHTKKKKEQNESSIQDEEVITSTLQNFYNTIESLDILGAMRFINERGQLIDKISAELSDQTDWTIAAVSSDDDIKKTFRVEIKKKQDKIEQTIYYQKSKLKKIDIDSEIVRIEKSGKNYLVSDKLLIVAESEDGKQYTLVDDKKHHVTFTQKNGTWKIAGKGLFSKVGFVKGRLSKSK